MMQTVKQREEQQLQQTITHAVIGRPVNVQGAGGEESNRQAVAILEKAAARAGFKETALL